MSNIVFNYNIELTWSIVKFIRDNVESLVHDQSEELAYACKMTTSELLENAVKYGSPISREKGIEFSFILNQGEARITVANGIIRQSDYDNVKHHIDGINASGNPQELYIQRLNTLLENPELNKSQLGLYRIAYEGEFSLEYEYEDGSNVLTITATKTI